MAGQLGNLLVRRRIIVKSVVRGVSLFVIGSSGWMRHNGKNDTNHQANNSKK
jgi:hypothetical protein